MNTFINADVTEKWNLGVIIPLVYKYLDDPLHLAPDVPAVNYSNGGLGDVSLLVTRRLGRINATSLTGIVGLPTGVWDATYTPGGTYLNQNAQLGFGKPTGALVLDQTFDQVWGVVVRRRRRGLSRRREQAQQLPRPDRRACMATPAIFWAPLSRPSASCCLDTGATTSTGTPSRPRRS